MWALRQVRDRLTDCHLVSCQSPPECTNSATSCFRKSCFRGVLRPATSSATGDSCCSEMCAGCAMASKHWSPATPATRDASGDRRARKCEAPRCKWWRSLCTKTFLIVVNLTFLVSHYVSSYVSTYYQILFEAFLNAFDEKCVYTLFRNREVKLANLCSLILDVKVSVEWTDHAKPIIFRYFQALVSGYTYTMVLPMAGTGASFKQTIVWWDFTRLEDCKTSKKSNSSH